VRRIHIDTDPGLDDALALALALALPGIRVCGVTTVAGNAPLEAVTRNAAGLLALAGADVPLGRGAAGPLALDPIDATHVHGADGLGGIPLSDPAPRVERAATEILAQSRAAGADTLVALGPLTNPGALARAGSQLLEGLELVWMGGALGPGNVTPLAEFNACADPAAVASVLESGLPLRVVPLDVTRHVALRPDEVPRGALGSGPLGRFLEGALHTLARSEQALRGVRAATLHDPCAVAAVARPELFRWEERRIGVVVEPGPERGRIVERPDGRLVTWAVEVRRDALVELILEHLAGGAPGGRARTRSGA